MEIPTGESFRPVSPVEGHDENERVPLRTPRFRSWSSTRSMAPTNTLSLAWTMLYHIRDEIDALPEFLPTHHRRYSLVAREQDVLVTARFLHELVSDIEHATDWFTLAPGEFEENDIAVRMVCALLLLQSEPTTLVRNRCLMCGDSIDPDSRPNFPSETVIVRLRHNSSCGYWTLNEVGGSPYWRDVDSRALCYEHHWTFCRCVSHLFNTRNR